jgi:hypothetical protein
MASNLMQTRTRGDGYIGNSRTTYEKVSPELATEWGMRCLNVIRRVFGADSDYYQAFKEQSSGFGCFDNYSYVVQGLSILKAAKDDYEKGYLFDTRTLIQAEVFDDFLDQATHLLENGYYGPAAVVAGAVLEDGLRKLCQQNNAVVPARATIEPMNVALAKTGLYGIVLQQKISALAAIRNKAAHGKWNEFNANDVKQMIDQMRIFMQNSFG